MTLDEINMAIAERCGWQRYLDVNRNQDCWYKTHEGYRKNVPNYSSSLDALHEALQSLTEIELFRYADEVCDLTCDSNHDTDIQTMLMLSAKELAECYVRAIGKWRGE